MRQLQQSWDVSVQSLEIANFGSINIQLVKDCWIKLTDGNSEDNSSSAMRHFRTHLTWMQTDAAAGGHDGRSYTAASAEKVIFEMY